MRLLRWKVFAVVVGLIAVFGLDLHPRAQGPVVTFHTIGDLPGGDTFSLVLDATRVGGVIYAVGSSSSLNTGPDTAILWTSDGVNPPVLTPLPDLVANAPIGAPGVASRAITRDARFIASVARNHPTLLTRVATRVSTSDLSLLNLMAAPFPTIPNSQGAFAISDDGMIVYVRSGMFASRIDINTSTNTTLPLLPGDDRHAPLDRGMSADGSVMVGFSVLGPSQVPEDLTPFRYVHGVGIEAIPRLGGGTFNRPLALSQDGNLTLLSGNSTHVPNGEVYIYDATVAAAPAVVKFGSPNTAWRTGQNAGGITADGEVSIVNYVYAGCGSACRFPFLHNDNGWFHLEAALGQGGIDVLNLPLHNLAANGISPDGTLVYGQGLRDTPTGAVTEGFVIEFPAGFLANFDVPAVPPAHSSIVGAWFAADTSPSALADPSTANPAIMVFLADGSFYEIEANVPASETGGANGYQRGRYRWNGAPTAVPGTFSGAFSVNIRQSTNGDRGFQGLDGINGFVAEVAGDTLTIAFPGCVPTQNPSECSVTATRVTGGAANPLAGAWLGGNALAEDSSILLVLLANGDYYFAEDSSSEPPPAGDPNGQDGIEKGTWSWNQASGSFSSWTTVDTNGQWGLNSTFPLNPTPPGNPNGSLAVALSPDGLSLDVVANTESFTLFRAAVVVAPTPTGTNVVVTPTAPAGATPVTLEFDTVTSGGETSLQLIDPTTVPGAPVPPAGFSLGDPPLYYEIDTTATFTGPVTVCFSYAGVTFPQGTPRLLHFDEALQSWVDITSSVDAATSTICGITSSFSPFAIAASQTTTSGFAPPISPIGSFQNVVKGGSTVPLKFNVIVNGVEKTDTAGLEFHVVRVGCSADVGETPVPFVTTGGTSLRYAGGEFVQNWKTPTTPGCYFVRVTGDGLLLNALFRVK